MEELNCILWKKTEYWEVPADFAAAVVVGDADADADAHAAVAQNLMTPLLRLGEGYCCWCRCQIL